MPAEMTSPLPDNRVKETSFDLRQLQPGDTIMVITENGSHYWLTRTSQAKYRRRWMRGVSVMTDSKSFGQITRGPADTSVESHIEIGKMIRFEDGGYTTSIVEIHLNGRQL